MKPIFRIFGYLRHYPWQIGFNIFFNLLSILFNLGSYVMIVPFVELLFGSGETGPVEPAFAFNQEQLAEWAFWHLHNYSNTVGLWTCLLIISGGYLACSLLSNLFRYLGLVFLSTIRNGVIEHLRNDLYHHITILPVSYFGHRRRGDLISRMANDLFDVEWSIVSSLQSLVKDPINVIVFCATLFFVSWRLFILFLLVLPAGVWLIARIGSSLKKNSQRGQNRLGRLFAMLEESLASLRAIKSFGREDDSEKRFREANNGYSRTMVRVALHRELSKPLSEVLGTLALVIILIVGGSWVIGDHIQPSVFIFFVIIFARIIPPIQAVVKAYNSLQKGSASAARFLEVLDADEVIVEKPHAVQLDTFSHEIVLRDVSFRYEADDVLQHIDLAVRKGQTVAIVGPSGSGKSTLVDLLPRFYDCTSGLITVDGNPIADLNINSLRRQFGLVSQNCILFNDTVANNISFGSDSYSLDQIREAARVAHADEFIEALPEGYNTSIGDRGLNLSGGQRQRLSIARAVLRGTPILILDEATSALDTESEHAVQQALESVMQGRTSIVIAHRLSTIRHADMIVVLDQGRIVEQGTHDELMTQGGLYKKLVDMQTFIK
ncbi:MAG: ABC transporter ATP-binding protein [Bacteroidales bacterium]|nr:ABC transporter ATP-binding protein [Bacteroidales bacterium]MBR5092429.1 ABC transporter ATP-binding protein [Bacteroidales bacterium]